MTTITLQPNGLVFDAPAGTTLLQALLGAGQQLDIKCNGNASCGNCHVFIHEGRKGVSRTTPAENAKLDAMVGIGSKSRLACQVVLGTDPIVIELPGALSGF